MDTLTLNVKLEASDLNCWKCSDCEHEQLNLNRL